MLVIVSQRAAEQLAAAPDNVARTFFKQLGHLLRDRKHHSLDAKKYPESGDSDLWQPRITKAWRFYFRIDGDLYIIDSATQHPK